MLISFQFLLLYNWEPSVNQSCKTSLCYAKSPLTLRVRSHCGERSTPLPLSLTMTSANLFSSFVMAILSGAKTTERHPESCSTFLVWIQHLTLSLMKHFPTFKTKFCPHAVAHTMAPES